MVVVSTSRVWDWKEPRRLRCVPGRRSRPSKSGVGFEVQVQRTSDSAAQVRASAEWMTRVRKTPALDAATMGPFTARVARTDARSLTSFGRTSLSGEPPVRSVSRSRSARCGLSAGEPCPSSPRRQRRPTPRPAPTCRCAAGSRPRAPAAPVAPGRRVSARDRSSRRQGLAPASGSPPAPRLPSPSRWPRSPVWPLDSRPGSWRRAG